MMDTPCTSTQDLSPAVEFDGQLALIDTFDRTEEELMVYAEFDPRQWAGEFDKRIDDAGVREGVIQAAALIASEMGFPCDPASHQQPHSLICMFPLNLSPDHYETPEEFEFAVWLFFVWVSEVLKIAGSSKDIEGAMKRVKTMSVRLAYHFGDDDPVSRAIGVEKAIRWINDLRYMHGCLDLESGALIDRETPVIRELKDKWGLE